MLLPPSLPFFLLLFFIILFFCNTLVHFFYPLFYAFYRYPIPPLPPFLHPFHSLLPFDLFFRLLLVFMPSPLFLVPSILPFCLCLLTPFPNPVPLLRISPTLHLSLLCLVPSFFSSSFLLLLCFSSLHLLIWFHFFFTFLTTSSSAYSSSLFSLLHIFPSCFLFLLYLAFSFQNHSSCAAFLPIHFHTFNLLLLFFPLYSFLSVSTLSSFLYFLYFSHHLIFSFNPITRSHFLLFFFLSFLYYFLPSSLPSFHLFFLHFFVPPFSSSFIFISLVPFILYHSCPVLAHLFISLSSFLFPSTPSLPPCLP